MMPKPELHDATVRAGIPALTLVAPGADVDELVWAVNTLHTTIVPDSHSHGTEITQIRCGTHTLDPDAVEYLDGMIVSNCGRCHDRFEIRWVPGGTGALMLRFVAEQILAHIDADADPPASLIEMLLDAHSRVQADRELVADSLALYQTLRHVLDR